MARLFSILAIAAVFALATPGDLLAASSDAKIKIEKCKNGNNNNGCRIVRAPEIDAAGGLIPIVLIGGTLLLAAESRRRLR